MLEAFEAAKICRDDDCDRKGIHPVHEVVRKPQVHRRPGKLAPWKQPDADGLLSSVMKATSVHKPRWFQEISTDVRDDFGSVTDRSIWRAIAKLVERGHLLKLELGLTFFAYIRPMPKKGRPVGRPETDQELRDYMMAIVTGHPTMPRER